MEIATITKSVNGSSSETLHHYRSFVQKTSLKDASFSSYIRPEAPKSATPEDNGCPVDDSDQISVFEAENYFNESNHHQKENKRVSSSSVVDDEAAAAGRCDFSAISRLSSVSSADGYGSRNYRAHRSFHATPTASSEASWNSQTGLLSNPPGSIPVSLRNLPADKQKKGGSSSGKNWFLCRRRCPCSGKKSVQVEEKLSQPRTYSISSYPRRHSPSQCSKSQKSSITGDVVEIRTKEKVLTDFRRFSLENRFESNVNHHHRHHNHHANGFSFPILNQCSKLQELNKGLPGVNSPLEDPPRDSLEVFQPPDESVSRKSMEVPPTAHSGFNRRGFAFPTSPMSRITATDDDVASDASSDLFEIESFSTQTTTGPIYRRRDSLDEATTFNNARRPSASLLCRRSLDEPVTPSVAATECYEPSEASIDWSVTTAEGFDRASITNFSVSASEIGEVAIMRQGLAKTCGGGEGIKRRSSGNGLLLSCRSEKAVSVVKCGAEEEEGGGGGGGGRRGVGGPALGLHVNGPHSGVVNKPPIGSSRAARLSLAFAT